MLLGWYEITKRYGLAACCVVGPLLFGLGGDYYATQWLLPVPDPANIDLNYLASTPPKYCGQPNKASTDSTSQPNTTAGSPWVSARETTPNSAASPCPELTNNVVTRSNAQKTDPNDILKFWTIGQQYRGRITYAIASAFLFLISGTVFLFALSIVGPKLGWLGTVAALIAFAGIAAYVVVFHKFLPPGRTFIVEKLLNKADTFFLYIEPLKMEKGGTGAATASLVEFNTIVSLWPIGMLLLALFVLSVRPGNEDLELGSLQRRLTLLRVALGLGSTFLVVGVLAQKVLMEWPLSLILDQQAEGLRLLGNALTLQVGAQGTMALFAAFAPAIAAWYLDAAALRRKTPSDDAAAVPRGSADSAASKPKAAEPLAFAPLSAIASFLALLAPLLASPFVDALKSLLLVFTKGSP